MAEYYLMSQLPSLDGISDSMLLPITEERFLELCHRFLGKKAQAELDKLSLVPAKVHEKSSSALIEAWNEGERDLRMVLGKVRGEKLKKPFDMGEAEHKTFSPKLMQAVREAVDMDSPMEAEKFLSLYRLEFLETLRPMDSFSEDAVFYYWLKLKLLSRIRQFDRERGESAYKNIYHSIMNGDRLEAI